MKSCNTLWNVVSGALDGDRNGILKGLSGEMIIAIGGDWKICLGKVVFEEWVSFLKLIIEKRCSRLMKNCKQKFCR